MNVPVPYNDEPAVVNNGCFRKCNPLGIVNINGTETEDRRYMDFVSPDGSNTWCSGNDPAFSIETNAICLPREECEDLCTALGDECESFDMHAYLPRCYLNTPDCGVFDESSGTFPLGAAAVYETDADYDVVVKTKTPTAAEDPTIA